MSLVTCRLCSRLFDAKRGKICTQCVAEIDDLYPKVREYIREHRDAHFDVDKLANDMDIDILRIQTMVELGYLDRDIPGISGADEERMKKEALARQIQGSLNPNYSGDNSDKKDKDSAKSAKMYGQERYGTGKKR